MQMMWFRKNKSNTCYRVLLLTPQLFLKLTLWVTFLDHLGISATISAVFEIQNLCLAPKVLKIFLISTLSIKY